MIVKKEIVTTKLYMYCDECYSELFDTGMIRRVEGEQRYVHYCAKCDKEYDLGKVYPYTINIEVREK